ncbi:hypothetical protein [Streptomyces sp. Isolate_45]|uniref:hypothetical protein n=1 Tax=Streptomyces sp. Isolate_45 TaxID=2950111 RepID=UPI0024819EB5|nr:hypothetical protein [Streptomyces sp. Isolate_45]MDA5282674.1 hypothetical protein [Streptomyces sp. Isolate_45]
MNSARRRTLVRVAVVTACAAGLPALTYAAAAADPFTDAAPAASSTQRTLVKSIALADGRSTARIYRLAQDAYQADILRAGVTVATLTSRDGSTGFGSAGELHAALRPDGRLTSWVGDGRPGDGAHAVDAGGHKTGTRSGHVVPASARHTDGAGGRADGAVEGGAAGTAEALRLNTLADGPGEGMLLLAAGGGIAAVGAAGLGFAMLRRGRSAG